MKIASRALLLMGLFSPLALMAPIQAAELGYELISPAQPTSDADKVEVVEFFWYGCPHCYDFEPYMEDWAKTKPDNVSYRLEAPPLNSSWTVHSRAFYAAETLGVLDVLHRPLFDAIHKDKRQLRTEDAIVAFAAELGLDKKAFAKAMNSFAVDAQIRRASQLARAHQIRGTPMVTINGKYKTSASLAGGHTAVIEVIRELVQEESSN